MFLGKTLNTVSSFKKGRLDYMDTDYSKKDHHNLGQNTRNKTFITAAFGSILYTLNSVGLNAESLFDFSKENVTKMVENFKDQSISDKGLGEITRFIGDNIIFDSKNYEGNLKKFATVISKSIKKKKMK